MYILTVVFIGIVGAVMGSFVGALTWRMKRGMDFVSDRSECEHCHHKLSTLDLVPIVSWVVLGGKCRYCHKRIGWTAIILEVMTSTVFVMSLLFWPLGSMYEDGILDYINIMLFAIWLVMVVLMIALLVYDARWRLLPNRLVFLLIGMSAIFAIVNNIFVHDNDLQSAAFNAILSILPITGLYGLIYMIPPQGRLIGFGDVKLGVAIGLILGWWGALFVLIISNLLGSLVAIPMLVRGKAKMSGQMAFGPFLIVATIIVFFFQQEIVAFVNKNLLLM